MTPAPAKINLALVVGPRRPDGKHEVATVLERVALADEVRVTRLPPGVGIAVTGFDGDTIVRAALDALLAATGAAASFSAAIEKRIPIAAGLGGGSSDAASALRDANALLGDPLSPGETEAIAARLGADVPFFLAAGAQLGTGDGSRLEPLTLPRDYHVVLWLPAGSEKASTAAVYAAFDAHGGADGFSERRAALRGALAGVRSAEDLAALPPNDLATSSLDVELTRLGAFRAGVTGAGPALYGLFTDASDARAAAEALSGAGRTWVTTPAGR
jgi:4-diphosphocytidyl-2-C-methyl-D-erythritol kinase